MDSFDIDECKGKLMFIPEQNEVTVRGSINDNVMEGKIYIIAACPIDRISSWSGSGLPFASAKQAFDNTPTKKTIELGLNNRFDFTIQVPNSYYVGLGTVLIPPTLFLKYSNGETSKVIPIQVGNPIPYRTLTYPMSTAHKSRTGPLFYENNDMSMLRTQEQILRDSAYPEDCDAGKYRIPENFWGSRPPV